MNGHSALDHVSVALSRVMTGRRKFFRDDTDCPDLPELLTAIRLEGVAPSGEGVHEVRATGPVEGLDPAFLVAKWLGPDRPTLIYHHGNQERPFDFGPLAKNTFNRIILQHRDAFDANLIVLRAPFHQSVRLYLGRVARLQDFATMLATSVLLAEGLVQELRVRGCPRILLCGASLGGWVTNLHRAHFDSADFYAPIMAGAALDEVFVSGAFRHLVGPAGRRNPDDLRRVLNFERAFAARTRPNVHGLLMRHDAIIELEHQVSCYSPHRVTVLDKGHSTGALASAEISAFLRGCLAA
ncbi:MAG: hypothetical protein EA350_11585 [Gemmatimonadales bacterium]|nr:MAG: hypothetical protein EA350_11585 [Gemmatimonadales bacterium]